MVPRIICGNDRATCAVITSVRALLSPRTWYQRQVTVDARTLGHEALAHADALYNLARYLTGNAAEADDLLQETFMRAVAGAGHFDGRNLKAWLFKVLRNTFIDFHRKAAPRHEVDGLVDADLLAGEAAVPLRHVEAADLEAAMLSLSEDARTVILLDLEGMTEVESAAILGCAVGTVKSRLSRARLLLRKKLVDYGK